MKYHASKVCLLSLLASAAITGCKAPSKDGFETDATTGVMYHFFNKSDNGSKPQMGDYAEVSLTLKNAKDSLIFNSAHRPGVPDSIKTLKIHLKEPYKGCLAYGLAMMSVGDSASFSISADSLYHNNFHSKNLPDYVPVGSMLTCNVKLLRIETAAEGKADREKRMQAREAIKAQRKADEANVIAKYVSDNKITAKPEADGMYLLKDNKGKGKGVKEGDSVEVKFTARLLDGTIVDQSDHGDQRTTYFVSYKKEPQLKGIDDALANMKEGEEITALFPSSLAFDDQQQGPLIEPYTPLLFDITLVKVKPGK
jgi:FKBP-type peptidyl-prolyl cis-trans isomerase FkpA